jgi:hypothetical protein
MIASFTRVSGEPGPGHTEETQPVPVGRQIDTLGNIGTVKSMVSLPSWPSTVSSDPQSTTAWATGARGEQAIGQSLDRLREEGIAVLHDRRIRSTSRVIAKRRA